MDYIKEISHLNEWEKRTRMSIDVTICAAYMLKTISKDECYKKHGFHGIGDIILKIKIENLLGMKTKKSKTIP